MALVPCISGPTLQGYVASTLDALVLFEAYLSGQISSVLRRPCERERGDLIRSGNILIYDECVAGIKRWTDGKHWSPSRVLGDFLIYRELQAHLPLRGRSRLLKRQTRRQQKITNSHRALVGSLQGTFDFKDEGLMKKTISITYCGVQHHLISYYTVEDVVSGRLMIPTKHPSLRGIVPRVQLKALQHSLPSIEGAEGWDYFAIQSTVEGSFVPQKGRLQHPFPPPQLQARLRLSCRLTSVNVNYTAQSLSTGPSHSSADCHDLIKRDVFHSGASTVAEVDRTMARQSSTSQWSPLGKDVGSCITRSVSNFSSNGGSIFPSTLSFPQMKRGQFSTCEGPAFQDHLVDGNYNSEEVGVADITKIPDSFEYCEGELRDFQLAL